MLRQLALITLLSLAATGLGAADFPLPALGYSEQRELADGWLFRSDPQDNGADEGWFAADADRSEWQPVSVPGVWQQAPGAIDRVVDGVAWFAIEVAVPDDWADRPVLQFLGAMYEVDAWFDGQYLGVHRGGYTPFALALPDDVRAGSTGTLVLRVDNRLSKQTVPNRHMGWQPFGGLTREVYLVARPTIAPLGLRHDTELADDGSARLRVAGRLRNDSGTATSSELHCRLLDDGALVAESRAAIDLPADGSAPIALALPVADPRCWSPTDPHRYQLELRWTTPAGERSLSMPVGLRELEFDGHRLLLNGERIWLQGFGVHEQWPAHGPCVPHDERARELALYKREYGINSLRPGHYPNHPELYRLCDELGILVFTEIPVWQLDRGFVRTEAAWDDWIRPQLDEMIDGYGAFTCVVSWGVNNEMNGTRAYDQRAVDYVRERDPTRWPMVVVASKTDLWLYDLLPLAGRNFHYGWYHSKFVHPGLRDGLAKNLRAAQGRPIWVAEIGAHAIRGRCSGGYHDRHKGSEFYQDKVVRFGIQYCMTQSEQIVGLSPWSWADFHRRGRIEPHGITDLQRRPKLVSYQIRNCFADTTRLLLCEQTTDCLPETTFAADCYHFDPAGRSAGTYRARWRIMHDGETLARGAFDYHRAADGPRAEQVGRIEWPIPADARGFHSLWVELSDADGAWCFSNACHFGVGHPPSNEPAAAAPEPPPSPALLRLRLLRDGEPVGGMAEWAGLQIPVYPHPGLQLPMPAGRQRLVLRSGEQMRTIEVELQAGAVLERTVDYASEQPEGDE